MKSVVRLSSWLSRWVCHLGAPYPLPKRPLPVCLRLEELEPRTTPTAPGSLGNAFGSSVSVSGTTTVIGAPSEEVNGISQQGAAYVFVQSGNIRTQKAELTAADGTTFDNFGTSVSVSGNTAVIGANGKNINGNLQQGAAYVFVQSGNTWTEQAELTAADGTAGDRFGGSVSVSGDTVVIGANDKNINGNLTQGAAYVFVRSGDTWIQQAELTAAHSEGFGNSVSVSGDTALIGASNAIVNNNNYQGAAYVFVQSGTTWSQQAELTAADGAYDDYFGTSVSVSGDTALIGAVGKTINGTLTQGAAYVFVRSGNTWTQQAELTAANGADGDEFGTSVSVNGDTALIGASRTTVGNNNPGAAYVFVQSGSTWTQQAELAAADVAGFGASVSLDGDTAVIGAPGPYFNLAGEPESGTAYVFVRAGSTWTQQAELAPPISEFSGSRPSDGSWSLNSSGTPGKFNPATDQVFFDFSPPGVTGVAGDWNGNGISEVGDFSNGTWHLDLAGTGAPPGANETFQFGQVGDIPVVGDWDGNPDGQDELGVFRTAPDGITGEFILDIANHRTMDSSNLVFTFGYGTDHIIVGDWNGNGTTKVGVYRDAASFIAADAGDIVFSIANTAGNPGSNFTNFVFGLITDKVVIGDWNGSGTSKVGTYRDGSAFNAPGTALFSLDTNGSLMYQPGISEVFLYGLDSDQFVTGHWKKTPPLLPEGTPQAQFAANGIGPGGVPALTQAQLAPVVQQAIAFWTAQGANAAQLEAVPVQIGQLEGNLVGWTDADGITISSDAAGWGWYTGLAPEVPANQMDLLTVVEHEFGHELGLSDVDPATHPGDLMDSTLPTGVRR